MIQKVMLLTRCGCRRVIEHPEDAQCVVVPMPTRDSRRGVEFDPARILIDTRTFVRSGKMIDGMSVYEEE